MPRVPLTSVFARLVWFPVHRVWKYGEGFARHSVPEDDLMTELAGKSVAIVGNARDLANNKFGAEIDQADIVVRINGAPKPSQQSHGRRTSWLALAVALDESSGRSIAPARVLWMSPKRKRLPFWVLKWPGFHLFSLHSYQSLKKQLGAPPTTGLMIIDLVQKSKAKSIRLYGFDFFSSLSLTGSRTQAQVPHNFAAEKVWVKSLQNGDHRVSLFT